MSLGLYPEFEPRLTGTRCAALGEVLLANIESLNRIARAADLTPITAFADNREVPDDFDGDPDDLRANWTEWFDPAGGLGVVRALANHLRTNPKAAGRIDGTDEVLDELDELARVLAVAAAQGVRFRFQVW